MLEYLMKQNIKQNKTTGVMYRTSLSYINEIAWLFGNQEIKRY
jgi:hypothetical protein